MAIKRSIGDLIFDVFLIILFVVLSIIMIYPLYSVLVSSLVSRGEYFRRILILWPEEFYFVSYQFIFASNQLLKSMGITVFVTIVGTLYSMIFTTGLSYGMSRSDLPGRKFFTTLILIPMFFGGGLIPGFLNIKRLGLMNTVWVMIIPAMISIWNYVVIRAFFQQLPAEMEESAKLDGANDLRILFSIILPLSLPVLATFSLFYGVGYWNTWYSAMLYISNQDLHPLQMVLRRMVVMNELPTYMSNQFNMMVGGNTKIFEDGVRYATVIVATIPIICVYPFLQKYFAKGILIGAVKG